MEKVCGYFLGNFLGEFRHIFYSIIWSHWSRGSHVKVKSGHSRLFDLHISLSLQQIIAAEIRLNFEEKYLNVLENLFVDK